MLAIFLLIRLGLSVASLIAERLTLSGNRLGRRGSAALLSAIRKRTSAAKGRKVL